MEKNELLSLIDINIDKAFEVLDSIFGKRNATYNVLCAEYTAPPRDFSMPVFISRLKRFVNTEYIPEKKPKNKKGNAELDHYDLLCQIDFQPQTTHFKHVLAKNGALSVLLHGENDADGNDLKWLYHQLLKSEDLLNEPPISIDFSGNANHSFEDLLNALCDKFTDGNKLNSSARKPRQFIREKVEEHLKASDLVVLVKYVKKVNDFEGFYNSFYSFLAYLHEEIDRDNSILFLLIENDLSDYNILMGDRFLWYDEQQKYLHTKKITDCNVAKIIDLAPVKNLEKEIIKKWISDNINHADVNGKLSDYLNDCDCFLDEGANRYHVIKKIYSVLHPENTKNLDQCLKY